MRTMKLMLKPQDMNFAFALHCERECDIGKEIERKSHSRAARTWTNERKLTKFEVALQGECESGTKIAQACPIKFAPRRECENGSIMERNVTNIEQIRIRSPTRLRNWNETNGQFAFAMLREYENKTRMYWNSQSRYSAKVTTKRKSSEGRIRTRHELKNGKKSY